jgi:hypothetical protein
LRRAISADSLISRQPKLSGAAFFLRFRFHWNFYAGNIFSWNAGLAAGLIPKLRNLDSCYRTLCEDDRDLVLGPTNCQQIMQQAARPMTLGNMRANGIRTLAVLVTRYRPFTIK